MASIPATKAASMPDDERPEADVDARLAGRQLADLEDRGADRDRGRHQEREAGRRLAVRARRSGPPRC